MICDEILLLYNFKSVIILTLVLLSGHVDHCRSLTEVVYHHHKGNIMRLVICPAEFDLRLRKYNQFSSSFNINNCQG